MTPQEAFQKAAADEGIIGTPLYDIALKTAGFESGWDANAVSNRNAQGLMQVMPATFGEIADQGWDIKNPYHNARAGIRYLAQGYEKSGGDPALTGAYYYGGPGGFAAAQRGEARYDPKNPDYPSTLEYGQRLANAVGQGNKPMSTNFPKTMGSIQNNMQGLANMLPEPEFTPEVAELMSRKNRQDASMLPLALGALLSGDKNIRSLGTALYKQGQEGRSPVMLGDDAIIDTNNGQMISNPMGDVNRAMTALPQAVKMRNTDKNVQADLTKADAQLRAANEWKALNYGLSKGQLDARETANEISALRAQMSQLGMMADPTTQFMMQSGGLFNGAPHGIGGGGPMATGGSSSRSALPLATGQTSPGAPGGTSPNQNKERPPGYIDVMPPGTKMQYDRTTGQPVFMIGQRAYVPAEDGVGAVPADSNTVAGTLMSADKFQTAVGEAQGEAAALARNKRILEQMQANPETFSDLMAFISGASPHWMTDRMARRQLTPEQYNLRVKVLRDAAEAIHELYGAALTAGEENRAQQFSISNTSTPDKIFAALTKVPSYLDYRRQTYGKGVFDTALRNSGLSDEQLVFPTYKGAVEEMTGRGQAPEQTQTPEPDDDIMDYVNKWSD